MQHCQSMHRLRTSRFLIGFENVVAEGVGINCVKNEGLTGLQKKATSSPRPKPLQTAETTTAVTLPESHRPKHWLPHCQESTRRHRPRTQAFWQTSYKHRPKHKNVIVIEGNAIDSERREWPKMLLPSSRTNSHSSYGPCSLAKLKFKDLQPPKTKAAPGYTPGPAQLS